MTTNATATGNPTTAFLMSFGAGMSTIIGAFLPFFISIRNTAFLSISLAFCAGVMTYVSFVEIYGESFEHFEAAFGHRKAVLYSTGCFFGGLLLSAALDYLVHRMAHSHAEQQSSNQQQKNSESKQHMVEKAEYIECCNITPQGDKSSTPSVDAESDPVTAEDDDEMSDDIGIDISPKPREKRESGDITGHSGRDTGNIQMDAPAELTKNEHLTRLSMISALAIAFHNFPEGIATFVSGMSGTGIGLTVALAIAIHNIPEGIIVAIPVYYATGSRWKAVVWASIAGLSEPIGALFAYGIVKAGGTLTDTAYGILFGVVGGMMVFISLVELLPTAIQYETSSGKQGLVNVSLIGGMAFMAASLVLFSQV